MYVFTKQKSQPISGKAKNLVFFTAPGGHDRMSTALKMANRLIFFLRSLFLNMKKIKVRRFDWKPLAGEQMPAFFQAFAPLRRDPIGIGLNVTPIRFTESFLCPCINISIFILKIWSNICFAFSWHLQKENENAKNYF